MWSVVILGPKIFGLWWSVVFRKTVIVRCYLTWTTACCIGLNNSCWWQFCRLFNCRILYGRHLPTVIHITGIPSPTLSFIPGLKPSFSANPSHCSFSFSSGLTTWISQTVYCYFWAYPFLLFSFSVLGLHFTAVPCGRLSWLMSALENTLK